MWINAQQHKSHAYSPWKFCEQKPRTTQQLQHQYQQIHQLKNLTFEFCNPLRAQVSQLTISTIHNPWVQAMHARQNLTVYSCSMNIEESVVKDGLILNYIPACVVHTHARTMYSKIISYAHIMYTGNHCTTMSPPRACHKIITQLTVHRTGHSGRRTYTRLII